LFGDVIDCYHQKTALRIQQGGDTEYAEKCSCWLMPRDFRTLKKLTSFRSILMDLSTAF